MLRGTDGAHWQAGRRRGPPRRRRHSATTASRRRLPWRLRPLPACRRMRAAPPWRAQRAKLGPSAKGSCGRRRCPPVPAGRRRARAWARLGSRGAKPGCGAAQFVPEERAPARPAGASVGPRLVRGDGPLPQVGPRMAPGRCGCLLTGWRAAARAVGRCWSQVSLQRREETKWLLSPPSLKQISGGGRRTQKEDQRAPPALKQTWEGRGAGAAALGCKARAFSVSLASAVVGVQRRHARGSSLGHREDPPQFINAGFAAQKWLRGFQKHATVCFHARKPLLMNFSGPLLALSIIQITCSPSDFTMVSSEIILYIGITELLLMFVSVRFP